MKGIIFNLLEHFISSKYGENCYQEIIASADTGTLDPFEIVGPGSYPDAAFDVILKTASTHIALDIPELLTDIGRHSLPVLAGRYPHFFDNCAHPREFLKTASMIHHVEVRKLYQGAEVPHFAVDEQNKDGFVLTYKSKRFLCHLAAGLIVGLGDFYKIPVSVKQTECTLSGDPSCQFIVKFHDENITTRPSSYDEYQSKKN